MILAKLKESTAEAHENLEKTVNVMNQMFSIDDYKMLLTKFYRFYSALEPKLEKLDWKNTNFDFEQRLKTPRLEKDLQSLGILDEVKNNVSQWDKLPEIDSIAQAFGSAYVMEGATLGGQIIMRHLKQHLGITPENGGAFFNSYGAEVGEKWKLFREAITNFAEKSESDEAIVKTAQETFESFRNCALQPVNSGSA